MRAGEIRPLTLTWLVVLLFMSKVAVTQTPSPALLVLEKEDRYLAIVDPISLRIVSRISAGEDPHEIAVTDDGTVAYISNYGAFSTPQHTLSVIDLVAQKTLPAVNLGELRAPHGLAWVTGRVYFTAEGSKAIGRYDPSSQQIDWVLGIGQNRTHMLVVAKDASRIFTSNVNSDSISVLDHDKNGDASGWTLTQIPVGKGPEGFDVSPDGSELWVANSHDGTVSIIDVASRKVAHTLDLHTKSANRLKFTPNGNLVLISDLGTGDLTVLDTAARKERRRISMGRAAAGILIVPDGSHAYVALPRDNCIAVVDLKTLSVTGRIETGKGPDGMTWAVRR